MIKRPVGSSLVTKRSTKIAGRPTSISLEDAFWRAFREIAKKQGVKVSDLITKIDGERQFANLSSAIRLFVVDYYRGIAERERKDE